MHEVPRHPPTARQSSVLTSSSVPGGSYCVKRFATEAGEPRQQVRGAPSRVIVLVRGDGFEPLVDQGDRVEIRHDPQNVTSKTQSYPFVGIRLT